MWEMGRNDPQWFAEVQTVDDTAALTLTAPLHF